MTGAMSKVRTALLVMLVFLTVLSVIGVPISSGKTYRKMQKLCSKNLSDALYTVCRDRGYNEPYSSGEGMQTSTGPGLVEECCHHSCTFEQLERYCKPQPEGKAIDFMDDVIEGYVTNLPYPPMRDLSSEQSSRSATNHAGDEIKRITERR